MNCIQEHMSICKNLDKNKINAFAGIILAAFKEGKKVLICGNGGSAADAQHLAAELVGRYKKERKGLPAIALTADIPTLTAISNDYGYNFLFSRQIEALGQKGDVVILISTSGKSPNLLEAAKKAKEMGITTIALLGKDGGKLKGLCDFPIMVSSNNTPRIQEMHILIIHAVCEIIEEKIFG